MDRCHTSNKEHNGDLKLIVEVITNSQYVIGDLSLISLEVLARHSLLPDSCEASVKSVEAQKDNIKKITTH